MQVSFTVPDVVFFIVHIAKYVENFSLLIPHYHTCRRNLEIQSRSLRLYFRNGQSSSYNFPFASLASKTKTNMYKEIVKRRKKNYLQRCKQDKVKVVNLCGSISTWFSNLQPKAVVHRYSSK